MRVLARRIGSFLSRYLAMTGVLALVVVPVVAIGGGVIALITGASSPEGWLGGLFSALALANAGALLLLLLAWAFGSLTMRIERRRPAG